MAGFEFALTTSLLRLDLRVSRGKFIRSSPIAWAAHATKKLAPDHKTQPGDANYLRRLRAGRSWGDADRAAGAGG
jgi:hypothetical protein